MSSHAPLVTAGIVAVTISATPESFLTFAGKVAMGIFIGVLSGVIHRLITTAWDRHRASQAPKTPK